MQSTLPSQAMVTPDPLDPARTTPSGLLVVDKPLGVTSMTVCRAVRRRLIAGGAHKKVKVGHGGTLDPLATGVVVVLVGRATRQCERVMAGEKRYLADIDLGHVSTTDDFEGDVSEICVFRAPERAEVERACAAFVGTIQQRPPAHSAMKVNGRRAYAIARAGKDPGLAERAVVIHSIDVLDYAWPLVRLDVRCAKGTYIRSLARDLGRALGGGGMLAGLRRTAVGEFTVERATELDALPEAIDERWLTPVDTGEIQ